MDELNTKLLEILTNNSRESFLKISKNLGVSEGTIRQRVKKLQKQGIIKSFTIKIQNESAIIAISTSPKIKTEIITKKIKEHAKETYEISGKYDIFAIITAKSNEEINDKVEKIRSINGVLDTETFTILKK